VAGRLQFIRDGAQEIGRKFKRRRLRSRLVALEGERKVALSKLGRRSWESRIDLAADGDLTDQLRRLDEKAGQLAARTSELQAQSSSLQTRRAAEVTRFDELSKPVSQKKTETEAALRAARAKLSDNERTIGGMQGRLKWLTDEIARTAQAAAAQPPESLLAEQKALFDQLAALAPQRETLVAEVNRLTGESQQLAQELMRIEAERKAALAPIDAELQRIKQESQGAGREISNVGREQTDRFTELGAVLYEQKGRHPALEELMQAVEAVDKNRAESQAALDASLALTRAMPPWTMLKFAAVPVLLVIMGLAVLLAVYYFSSESSESGPLGYLSPHMPGTTKGVANGSASADESRKDEIVQAFLRSPGEESRRLDAVEILENDLMNVGSTADRGYLPYLVKILRRGEPELRAAAGHSIGMIGPAATDVAVLVEALNDPVPGVRAAALAALRQVRQDAKIGLLVRRVQSAVNEGAQRKRERFSGSRFSRERLTSITPAIRKSGGWRL
jgi:hypothetical protein